MITEKQQIKLDKLRELYYNDKHSLIKIEESKFIEILRDSKWNMTDSINSLLVFHEKTVEEIKRVENLPKNTARPSDCQGHDETWEKYYKCPNCSETSLSECHENFCSNCGIKVDWSEFKQIQ